MKKIELKKGINLYLIPDSKFKTYSAQIYIHAPLMRECVTENALLPFILKRGTKKYPTKKLLSEKLDMILASSLGAGITKSGEIQRISFSINGIADAFSPYKCTYKEGLELLFQVLLDPISPFDDNYIESEKLHLAEKIESEKNDKRSYAQSEAVKELCRGEAFALSELGYLEDIASITKEDLARAYNRLINDFPIDIIVCGSFDSDDTIEIVKSLTEPLAGRDSALPITSPLTEKEFSQKEETMKIAQGKLCIGFKTGAYSPKSKEALALMLYNSIYGGGAHSKLFLNVREKLSLAYYASSLFNLAKGFILVSSGIEASNFDKAKDEILLWQEKMTEGDFTEEEIAISKKAIINSYRSTLDSIGGLASFAISQITNGTFYTVDEIIKKIEALTKDDILAVAKDITPKLIYFLKGE